MIVDIIQNSMDKPYVAMTDEVYEAMMELRSFMFRNVYTNPVAKAEDDKAKEILVTLFDTFTKDPDTLVKAGLSHIVLETERDICDYIAGMTDNYAIYVFKTLFLPQGWQIK